jgi:hypothetical protein
VTGVVNTAARAAHNAKASKVVTRTVVAITTSKETHKFQVEKPSDDVLAVIGPAIRSLNQYQATLDVLTAPPPPVESPAPAVQPPPSQATPTSVADELKKLAELRDAGILSEEEFVAAKARLL